jgi:zinc D-Ala-D-Ala carboxypeptidase
MKLTPNFSLPEFLATNTKIENIPNSKQLARITNTAQCMELVRLAVGNKPCRISSGFRCLAVNSAVGGSTTSAHIDGDAVDFTVAGMTNKQICEAIIRAKIKFDQLIDENKNGKQWVHISFAEKLRHQYLIFSNGKYVVHS